MTTEPTDAEIADMARKAGLLPDNSHPAPETRATRRQTDAVQAFARAVLARWGQPSGAGNTTTTTTCPTCMAPCTTTVNPRGGDYGWGTTDLERTVYRHAPQPTQAVPPAGREPLTEAQRQAIYDEHCYLGDNGWEVNWSDVVDAVEAAHGIKGKEAGNA